MRSAAIYVIASLIFSIFSVTAKAEPNEYARIIVESIWTREGVGKLAAIVGKEEIEKLQEAGKNLGLSDSDSRRLAHEITEDILDRIVINIRDHQTRLYDENFTVAELSAAANFSRTPAGRSFFGRQIPFSIKSGKDIPLVLGEGEIQNSVIETLERLDFVPSAIVAKIKAEIL